MPLSWNEIRDRSLGFSREWAMFCFDFARFRPYDLEPFSGLLLNQGEVPDRAGVADFPLGDLSKNVNLLGFIAGYQTRSFGQQLTAPLAAATKPAKQSRKSP